MGAAVFGVLTAAGSLSTASDSVIIAEDMPVPAEVPPAEPIPPLITGHQQTTSLPPPARIANATRRLAASLDDSLEAALRVAAPPRRFLLLTFGNLAVRDHLLNFCHHAARVGASHVVGAVDVATFELLAARGIPSYKTPLAFEQYALDGANSHASRSWQRFASMRTGEVARVVDLGYHVLHTDTDVIWLRNPMPYIMCTPDARRGEHADDTPFPCAEMLEADVAVSSDNMGPGRAVHGRGQYHSGGTFNSGILLFRPSANGRIFVRAWHENVAKPARSSRFFGRTSDQQVFNAMVRRERTWPGVSTPRPDPASKPPRPLLIQSSSPLMWTGGRTAGHVGHEPAARRLGGQAQARSAPTAPLHQRSRLLCPVGACASGPQAVCRARYIQPRLPRRPRKGAALSGGWYVGRRA